MTKLEELTACFNELREDPDYEGYTEEKITEVLSTLDLDQYETILDIPTRVINDIFYNLTEGKQQTFDPIIEQEILDLFERSMMSEKTNAGIIAKCIRYLMRKDTRPKSALLVVDVQNDFISGGLALKNSPAGQDGEEVVELINPLLDHFPVVVYTGDWHPEDHCSFHSNVDKYPMHETSEVQAEDVAPFTKVIFADGEKGMEQMLWPDHCIQESEGAQFHPDLTIKEDSIIIHKGQDSAHDSYSAFWDNCKCNQTELFTQLIDADVTNTYVCGLALDYCVAYTALDAAEHGFHCHLIEEACRGVAEESIDEMKKKMKGEGVAISKISEFIESEDSEL